MYLAEYLQRPKDRLEEPKRIHSLELIDRWCRTRRWSSDSLRLMRSATWHGALAARRLGLVVDAAPTRDFCDP